MTARDPTFGIDLGAAKVCVAAVDGGGVLRLLTDHQGHGILPAVVSFDENCHVLIGEDAVARWANDPGNTIACDLRPEAVPTLTRAGQLRQVDIGAILLDHVRRMANAALQVDSKSVVLTLPGGYDEARRQLVIEAAVAAGLDVSELLLCPQAACYAYGLEKSPPQFVAVCDFGATKFECSIIAMRDGLPMLLATVCEPGLGGDLLNERITEWMVEGFHGRHGIDLRHDQVAMYRLRNAAERSKRKLFPKTEYGVQVAVPDLVPRADGSQLGLDLHLTEAVFSERTSDLVERILGVCDKALYQAGMTPEQLLQIILIGGSCRIPAVQFRVGAFFGRTPRMDVDPEAACALGAALFAAHGSAITDRVTSPYGAVTAPPAEAADPPVLRRKTRVGRVVTRKMFTAVMDAQVATDITDVDFSPPRPALVEVTAFRLAISTVGGFCDEVIPSNEPIPAAKTRIFSTGKDGQPQVSVSVCQGDSRRFVENTALGTIVLDNLPPRPRGQVSIAVTFAIDDDGVLEASARDEATGQEQSVRINLPR